MQARNLLIFTALTLSISTLLPASYGFAQMIVGHRGASFDAPENTLAAFNEAWRQGADGIEGDFYYTSDQQIVCIHDKTTERTGGKKLDVAHSTLKQLRELEYGAWKDKQFAGEPLPTLAEVLATVPEGKTFVIELKTGPEIVPLLKAQLTKLNADPQSLLIIAFDANTIAAAKKLMPEIRAHWLTSYKFNQLTRTWKPTLDDVAKTLQQCGADGLGTKGLTEVVNESFIKRLTELGMGEFHVWTIDDPKDAAYFQKLGAVGITTNRPKFIRQALSN